MLAIPRMPQMSEAPEAIENLRGARGALEIGLALGFQGFQRC